MTLSELLIKYRREHGLSQRQMAAQCNLSTGYISLIEKTINPQTGKAMIPTLTVLNKLAKGMGITIDNLFSICDDMPVSLSREEPAIASDDGQKKNIVKIAGRDTSVSSSVPALDTLSPADCALLAAYHAAPPEIQNIVHTALAPYKTQNPAASENAAG